jgi:hypothetical protein
MTEGELKAIQWSGMLRGGNPGKTYFTKIYINPVHTLIKDCLYQQPQHYELSLKF